MPSFSTLSDPNSYHILAYGTLLGSNLFQTFLNGPIAFKALPRASFSTLQQAIFPPYFSFQTVLPLALILTWPGDKILGAAGVGLVRKDAGWRGLLQEGNQWTALLPISITFATSLINLTFLGPQTTKVMRQRKHQETRDGKRYYDPGPKSEGMQKLNSSFALLHGLSSFSNLMGTFAMLFYGLVLAEKI